MQRLVVIALVLLIAPLAHAEVSARQVKLAATLFGETVGEVELSLDTKATTHLTYRSDLRVIRNSLTFRNQALIDVSFDPASGRLVHSKARRCTSAEDGSTPPRCDAIRELSGLTAIPALAAELILARQADGVSHCIDVVDEESGAVGAACAVGRITDAGVELSGSKLNEPFHAVVSHGLLHSLELPRQGAAFSIVTGAVQLSSLDLFAEPIPSTGDAPAAIARGALRLRLFGIPRALAELGKVSAPGQSPTLAEDGASIRIDVTPRPLPKHRRSKEILDRVALLLAKARNGHIDCQAATSWFLARAKSHHWSVKPAEGLAFVDGRFAYHQWAIVETPDGPVPVDPLLAQVPADVGHVQLAEPGVSAGPLLVSFQRSLSVAVE